jgi:hypothetical protein
MTSQPVACTTVPNQQSLSRVVVPFGNWAFRVRQGNHVVFSEHWWLSAELTLNHDVSFCSLNPQSLCESHFELLTLQRTRIHWESLDFPFRSWRPFDSIFLLAPRCVNLFAISCSWFPSQHSILYAFEVAVHGPEVTGIDHYWSDAMVSSEPSQLTSRGDSTEVFDFAWSPYRSIPSKCLLTAPASFDVCFCWVAAKCLGVIVPKSELQNPSDRPNAGVSSIRTPKKENWKSWVSQTIEQKKSGQQSNLLVLASNHPIHFHRSKLNQLDGSWLVGCTRSILPSLSCGDDQMESY